MRTPWCSSYFSLRPRRMEMVSSTVGSPTKIGWNRRCSAGSFSTYLRYSSSVVAPMQCNSPRDRAGFKGRSEEHTSELQSLMRISYAVFCLKKKKITTPIIRHYNAKHIITLSQNPIHLYTNY